MHISKEQSINQLLHPRHDIYNCQLSLDLALPTFCGLWKGTFLLNAVPRLNCWTTKAARCDLIVQKTQTLSTINWWHWISQVKRKAWCYKLPFMQRAIMKFDWRNMDHHQIRVAKRGQVNWPNSTGVECNCVHSNVKCFMDCKENYNEILSIW